MKLLARALAAFDDPEELTLVAEDILKIKPLRDLEWLRLSYDAPQQTDETVIGGGERP
jgi:hypothetical protein